MGFHRARPPLTLSPGLSRRFALLSGLIHGLACAVIMALPIGLYRLPLLFLVGASGLYVGYVHVLRRAPWSIRAAVWESDGSWRLLLVSGTRVEVSLSSATFVSLPLVVLNFRAGRWRRHAIPLFADALDPERLRRLRQRLRVEGGAGSRTP